MQVSASRIFDIFILKAPLLMTEDGHGPKNSSSCWCVRLHKPRTSMNISMLQTILWFISTGSGFRRYLNASWVHFCCPATTAQCEKWAGEAFKCPNSSFITLLQPFSLAAAVAIVEWTTISSWFIASLGGKGPKQLFTNHEAAQFVTNSDLWCSLHPSVFIE